MAGFRVTTKWRGIPQTKAALTGVEPKVRAGAIDGLKAIGLGLLSTSKERIQRGSKSGRIYEKYGPRRTHRASAPGESPATDTGGLVSSGFQELDAPSVEVRVGFGKLYAAMLEYGTRRMAARPFLLPALDEWRERAVAILRASIKAKLK